MRYLLLMTTAVLVAFAPAQADDGVSFDDDGLTLEAADGNLELTLGGRLHVDAAWFHVATGGETDAGIRRARLELGGQVADVIRFRVDREFAKGGGWRNVWASIEPIKDFQIRGGNMIVPFSMEEMQSSNDTALMERSLLSSITPGFSLGGMATYNRRNFTVAAGYFGNALTNEDERTRIRGKGAVGRVSFAPLLQRRSFAHVAVAVENRDFDPGEQLRFSAKPGTDLAPTLLNTGDFAASSLRNLGAEAAYSVGSLLIQGQYGRVKIERDLFADSTFDGWYAQASYVLTGEKYDYSRSSGVVRGVDVRRKGNAVEVAGRISGLDLRDGDILAGNARTYTLGVNYYLNRNVRLMLNYAHSKLDAMGATEDELNSDVAAGRLQIAF